jgi:hypothetical protein
MNKAQRHYEQHQTKRDLILKARQMGFSTLLQLEKLERVLLKSNITSATIAHKQKKTTDIFQIAKFAWDNLPEEFRKIYKVRYDNVRELAFDGNKSRYFVDVDLRSSTVQDLHVSEIAFVKNLGDFFASTLEAVPADGRIALETTANGLNQFHDLWTNAVEGKSEFKPHFYNWAWDGDYVSTPPLDNKWKEDYKILAKRYNLILDMQSRFQLSDSQFFWYYLKALRQKELIKQEYPTIPEEAFLTSSISVFDLFEVSQLKARDVVRTIRGVNLFFEPILKHEYIVGIDTAEGVGGDSTGLGVVDVTDPDNMIEVAYLSDNTIRPDQTGELAVHIAKVFNNAFIIPERNSSGLSTVLKIQELGYRNLFVNTTVDKKTQKTKNEYGWRTTNTNRDLMIDDFVEMFETKRIEINSEVAIQQMKTFVRKDNGKREHEDGYHDDNIFALLLAVQGNKYHRSARVFTKKANVFA